MIMLQADPFETTLNPGKTALVVIDIQRDFVEPGGFGASLGNDVTRLHSAGVLTAEEFGAKKAELLSRL